MCISVLGQELKREKQLHVARVWRDTVSPFIDDFPQELNRRSKQFPKYHEAMEHFIGKAALVTAEGPDTFPLNTSNLCNPCFDDSATVRYMIFAHKTFIQDGCLQTESLNTITVLPQMHILQLFSSKWECRQRHWHIPQVSSWSTWCNFSSTKIMVNCWPVIGVAMPMKEVYVTKQKGNNNMVAINFSRSSGDKETLIRLGDPPEYAFYAYFSWLNDKSLAAQCLSLYFQSRGDMPVNHDSLLMVKQIQSEWERLTINVNFSLESVRTLNHTPTIFQSWPQSLLASMQRDSGHRYINYVEITSPIMPMKEAWNMLWPSKYSALNWRSKLSQENCKNHLQYMYLAIGLDFLSWRRPVCWPKEKKKRTE